MGRDLDAQPAGRSVDDHSASGPAITESVHEVTLHAERPVSTEAQPVERVRLGKETVTDTETVTGEIRKERTEVDTANGGKRKR